MYRKLSIIPNKYANYNFMKNCLYTLLKNNFKKYISEFYIVNRLYDTSMFLKFKKLWNVMFKASEMISLRMSLRKDITELYAEEKYSISKIKLL